MIKKILKIVLIILILAALAAGDFWMVWKKGLTWWAGGAIYLGIVGLFVGLLFLKKYLLRRKEKKFVQRVVQLDESAIKGAPLHERQQLQDLQDHWKESVDLLKRSTLKKHGNPLYALPWYVVIGESGSGKTTAIRNSRLESPVNYPDRAATISATLNCDWWFFENSIILDTAGRYTIPLDDIPDREEWEKLLTLFAKYRRREPVNGVIATIPADKLLAGDRSTLREDGQNIRKRIDQLMRVVGARFPVYILVTKTDMVYGFNDTFSGLAEEDASQAMGYVNRNARQHWDMLLDEAFESISERIGNISMSALRTQHPVKPGTIVFLKEFFRLKTGLVEFMKAVFGDNPYQETPLLRGIFFSSGRQGARHSSEFLDAAGIPDDKKEVPASDKSFFLKDIFARILPGDRSLYTHTHDFLRWRRITRSLGFTSWLLVWAALCGLLTFSFARNVSTLNNFMDIFKKLPSLTTDTTVNLLTIEKFRLELEELEQKNSHWLLPSFGLTQSKVAEQKGKEHYITLVNKGFLWGFDKSAAEKVDKLPTDADPDRIAVYANYIVTRLNVLNSWLDKGDLPEEPQAFVNTAGAAVDLEYPSLSYETSQTFGYIYLDYLRWHNNRAELLRNRELIKAGLTKLIVKRESMDWLVHKSIPNAPNVLLDNFWGSAEVGEHDETVFVPGAYTKEGRKHIAEFIGNMESVLKDNDPIKNRLKPFWKWYQEEYFKAWYAFADNFHKGAEAFQTETARQNMASLMTTDHNPYWKLILRLADESIQSDPQTKPPAWTRLSPELVAIALMEPADQKEKKKEGIVTRVEERIKKVEAAAEQKMQQLDPEMKKIAQQRLSRAKILAGFQKALSQTAPVATSGDTALRMVSDLFAGQASPTEDKSPFNVAYTQYLSLKSMMKEDGYGDTDFLWSVFGGPLNYLIDYGVQESSCLLQLKWEGDVIGKTEDVPKEKLLKSLFDKTVGVVVQFRDGPAKPFIISGKLGYGPKKVYENTIFENSISFRPEFFKFINAGATAPIEFQSDYTVSMETLPIEVNRDAPVKPTGNLLSLQCSDGLAILKNYNYPDSRSFRWSPEKCGDTILKITFPDFTLTKIYKGKMGFANFLSDFASGGKAYKTTDFPESKMSLSKTGVKWIKIKYKIDNAQPVIATLKKSSKKAPTVITDCMLK